MLELSNLERFEVVYKGFAIHIVLSLLYYILVIENHTQLCTKISSRIFVWGLTLMTDFYDIMVLIMINATKYLMSACFWFHMVSKSGLSVQLSKLLVFSNAKTKLEQYPTDSEVAATVLWDAYMQGNIENKIVVDLGCGTGILGLGAILLGARFVYFIDIDKEALEILAQNIADLEIPVRKYKLLNKNVEEINKEYHVQVKADVVIQNPPFGTREKHVDKQFLEKAFTIASTIYSFHKTTSKDFISALSRDHKINSKLIHEFNFPLRASMKFHKKKIERISVGCWKFFKM
jgi:predicted RNA methylase